MKRLYPLLLALPGMLALTPAQAADQKALANVKGCSACHEMSTKKVGPAYKEIAKKYAGQKDAQDKLVKKTHNRGQTTVF